MPCPLLFPYLSERDEWPTTSVSGILGKSNTRAFQRYSPGNVPQGRGLFLNDFLLTRHFLKPVRGSRSYLRRIKNSLAHWLNTVVFLLLALRQRTRT